jgi:hypothetical protein
MVAPNFNSFFIVLLLMMNEFATCKVKHTGEEQKVGVAYLVKLFTLKGVVCGELSVDT